MICGWSNRWLLELPDNRWMRIAQRLLGLLINWIHHSGSNCRRLKRHGQRFVGSHSNTTDLRYYQILDELSLLAGFNLLIFVVQPPWDRQLSCPRSGQRIIHQHLLRFFAQLPKLTAFLHELPARLTDVLGQPLTANRHHRETTHDLHLPHGVNLNQRIHFAQTQPANLFRTQLHDLLQDRRVFR